ncbi:hypothetical protein QYF36_011645 [Acer negundo]|nr:hypothetical protein QYF36_011645 [Acer negundo]
MSGLENSSAQAAHKPEPLLTFHKDSDFSQHAESFIVEKFNKLKPDDSSNLQSSMDQPSMSNTEDGKISLCRQSPETCLNDNSDADTCAALRSLLRKCASLRAGKSELDDEVVMLNILATLSGRYFGQSED